MKSIQCGDLLFVFNKSYSNTIIAIGFIETDIECAQTILTIEFDGDDRILYLWFNEGNFPYYFDTIRSYGFDEEGEDRLRIVGVDVI